MKKHSRMTARPGTRSRVAGLAIGALALAIGATSGCTFSRGDTSSLTGGGDDAGTDTGTGPREDVSTSVGGDVGTISGADGSLLVDAPPCNHDMTVVIRDFRGYDDANGSKHPDFEYALGSDKGFVAAMLGSDTKPVYGVAGPTKTTHGPAEFDQWYRDTDGVNQRFEITIPLTEDPARPGTYLYDSSAYFPIDGMGFGNQNQRHNYHFTSETHFTFPYRGGEVFTFRGDDDLFLFVNGHLAIDLGGVHTAETGTVDLDAQAADLGIAIGNTYQMDIFHAERHTSESNFRVETTLSCIDSIVIP